MADERYQITAIIGPWCGYVITLPKDEALAAVADRWAVARDEPPYDMAVAPTDYPKLTGDERAAAAAAAQAWFDRQIKPRMN
jgi:hypothetical protein